MNRYKRKRTKAKLTRGYIAQELGIDYKRYELIEKGVVKMPTNLIDKFNSIFNKTDGEIAVDKIEQKEEVEEWFKRVCKKDENGKRELDDLMKEFNVNSFSELAKLLGYSNPSSVLIPINGVKRSRQCEEKIYNFFHNELNIQEPHELHFSSKRLKNGNGFRIIEDMPDSEELLEWYVNFNFSKFLVENNKSCNLISEELKLPPANVNRYIRKKVSNLRYNTIKQLKKYCDSFGVEPTEVTVVADLKEKVLKENGLDSTHELRNDFPIFSQRFEESKVEVIPSNEKIVSIKDKYLNKLEQMQHDLEIKCEEFQNLSIEIEELKNNITTYNEFIEDLEEL